VDDRVQGRARLVVSEDEVGKPRAIERTVGGDDVRTEAVDDRLEYVGPCALELVDDRVRVDHNGTALGEEPSDRAFPGTDAARQPDEQHPATPSVRCDA